jgi:MATE family multidrug resistance protein
MTPHDARQAGPGSLSWHLRQTIAIAAPTAVALLGQLALALTDQVMLGRISDAALAAGGLGARLFFTVLMALQGVVSGVAVLAARAQGAGKPHHVPQAYWSGLCIAAVLALPFFWLMSHPGEVLLLFGEPATLAADVASYLDVLRWGVPAGLLGIGMVRAFLPAVGLQGLTLWVMPFGIALNLLLNIWFIHGGLGVAAHGMRGSAAATAVTMWAMALGLAALLHGRRSLRHHVRLTPPRPRMLRELMVIGLPVAVMSLVETALFLATGLLVGVLGAIPLAAHTLALSVASTSFMVPLAISQTATVRVAEAMGANRPAMARRAGLVAIALSAVFMGGAAILLLLAPRPIAGLYLAPGSQAAVLGVTLLRIAGVFQIVDGIQVTAAGALRGLKDTRVPMLLAGLGYWGIGFWTGHHFAITQGLGAAGLWWGLFAGLAVVAVALTTRFAVMTRVTAGRH